MTQTRASITRVEEIINTKEALNYFIIDARLKGFNTKKMLLNFYYKEVLKATICIEDERKAIYVIYTEIGEIYTQRPCIYNIIGTNIYLTFKNFGRLETFKIQLSELVVSYI